MTTKAPSYPTGRAVIALLALASFMTAQGCSLFVPSQQILIVRATDPDAEVSVDGRPIGKGSGSIRVARNHGHTVTARIGDRNGIASVGTTVSPTGFLDIVGGVLFLIPFIGVAAPGFWQLEPDTVTVFVPSPRQ